MFILFIGYKKPTAAKILGSCTLQIHKWKHASVTKNQRGKSNHHTGPFSLNERNKISNWKHIFRTACSRHLCGKYLLIIFRCNIPLKLHFLLKLRLCKISTWTNDTWCIPAPKLLSIDFSILIKSCHFSEPSWKAGAKLKNIYQGIKFIYQQPRIKYIYINNQESR